MCCLPMYQVSLSAVVCTFDRMVVAALPSGLGGVDDACIVAVYGPLQTAKSAKPNANVHMNMHVYCIHVFTLGTSAALVELTNAAVNNRHLRTLELHLHCVISPQAMQCLSLLSINKKLFCCAGLTDANSSAHAAFATNYETLLASVLSVPASQAQLESLQTGAASAPAPARRRLLETQVGHHCCKELAEIAIKCTLYGV